MSDKQVMAYRGFCEHGKVRMLMIDPATGEHDPEYVKDCYRELSKWARKGIKSDLVTVEEARKSDMHCDICDAPKPTKRKPGKKVKHEI